jgi:hypothetical protein
MDANRIVGAMILGGIFSILHMFKGDKKKATKEIDKSSEITKSLKPDE